MFYGAEAVLVVINTVWSATGVLAPPVLWRNTKLDLLYGNALCRDHSLVFSSLYIWHRAR